MRRCTEAAIITARGGSVCGRPLPLCQGARASGAVPLSGRPASLAREACWLGPWRKIRRTGALGLARSLSGGTAPLERTSQATSLASTRGARSGGRHMSGRSDSQTRSLSSEGSPPRGLSGRPVLGPISLLGLASHKLGPLGNPGLFPHHLDRSVTYDGLIFS